MIPRDQIERLKEQYKNSKEILLLIADYEQLLKEHTLYKRYYDFSSSGAKDASHLVKPHESLNKKDPTDDGKWS